MIAANKSTGKEYEVLDYRPDKTGNSPIFNSWIQIKKTPKAKPVWHTLRDYYIKEK